MNLKNSKFYKRIQELRRFSKEKIRKDREQRTCARLDMALSEQRPHHESDLEWSSSPRRRSKKTKGKKKAASRLSGGKDTHCSSPVGDEIPPEAGIQSYIQLNDKCYRLACTRQVPVKSSRDDDRSISYGDAMNYALTHKRTFILKPDSGAQGRGIWLTNDLKTIGANERLICQTYVHRPLLIDGYKFDLRVYTLITSVDPLRIFVYNEGLARFATNKYVEPTPGNSNDLYMHLTNYSVNKRNSHYELCDNDDCGSKRKLSAINNWMRRHNYDVEEFWTNVDDVIIKTVLSAWPVLKHNYHACFPGHDKIQACFEILGFDILVDWKLKPYILEVNHSPSFHTNEQVDREVKRPLIRDTLNLVSAVLADKKQIMREDRKRVKQRLLKTKGETLQRPRVCSGSTKTEGSPKKVEPEEDQDPLAQQVAWEDSHMGNFRRIMPPPDGTKAEYYSQFYGQTNQVSIFAETAASKKREDLARKMRLQIEEKKAKQDQMLHGRNKTDKRKRQLVILPRAVREKNRVQLYRLQEHWLPGFISEAEERLRHTWLQMRTEAIKTLRITENVYATLYEAGNLTNTDMVVFPHLYQHLQNGFDIKQHT
ncbi:GL23051 [Drosophila persimilis]|uniref:GL23051 n=1 Tax=Drosophila persimilis TaxID=7234 RepID=B4G3V4_DROPE|nr:GL23051 [Drosophila persimilis]